MSASGKSHIFRVFVDDSDDSKLLTGELEREGMPFYVIRISSNDERQRRELLDLPAVDTGDETFYGMTEIRAYLGIGLMSQ
jgi:hypothetical protein